MAEPVAESEIVRLDALYHRVLELNRSAESSVPEEMRSLTPLDLSIVNAIAQQPDLVLRELARNLHIPNSTLTSALNRLEEKGVAHRTISKRDRRSFGIRLSEKGLRIQKVHIEFEKAYFTSLLGKLDSHEERARLLELAEKIVDAAQRELHERRVEP